jgi:hypothetical protein
MLVAFCGVIVLPLLAAFVTEKLAEGRSRRKKFLHRLAWFPVPLLAVVVIVFQSLVELFGMVAYLWWVPKNFSVSSVQL